MPLIIRFAKNVDYDETSYGDLAAISGNKKAREYRRIRFVTDSSGFRNDVPADKRVRPVDLIMLGDSFGEGTGTSQENTWSAFFERDYGLNVYNFSIENNGPWQEFTTLTIEIDRLSVHEGTVVLWQIFTGNDLEDLYFAELEKTRLPWNGSLGQLSASFRNFRFRSPINQMLRRMTPGLTPDQVSTGDFLDGHQMLFLSPYAERSARTVDQVLQHPNYPMLKATIRAMKRFADANRIKVAIVLAPSKDEVYSWVLHGGRPWSTSTEPSGFSKALEDISREEQIGFFDLKPSMVDESRRLFERSGDTLWWHDDTHWNTFGHRFAAAETYRHFQKELQVSASYSLRPETITPANSK